MKSTFNFILLGFCFVLIPFIVGFCMYDYFHALHPLGIFPYKWLNKIPNVSPWVYYNVPCGLWAFAFLSAILLVWKSYTGFIKGFFIVLTILFGFAAEILQHYKIISGFFDMFDLLAIAIGFLLSLLIFNPWKKNKVLVNPI